MPDGTFISPMYKECIESSGNKNGLLATKLNGKSFINTRNSKGPRMDP
jgi:hypothetical protein